MKKLTNQNTLNQNLPQPMMNKHVKHPIDDYFNNPLSHYCFTLFWC